MDQCPETDGNPTNQFWQRLQRGLRHYDLPETEDRTKNPRPHSTIEEITMVVVGEPFTCLSLCVEGGKQCPGGLLLVPSSAWLQKEPSNSSNTQGDLQTLRVHKAVTFDSCGRTFLDIFNPPRRVTYLMNLSTGENLCVANNLDFEMDLVCPVGVTEKLARRLDNRIVTRVLTADAGVAYPDTLAFSYRPRISYNPGTHSIFVIPLEDVRESEATITKELGVFMGSMSNKGIKKVVVKAPGSGSPKTLYYSTKDVAGVYSAVWQTLMALEEAEMQGSVVVESFCETAKPLPVPCRDYEERAVGIETKPLSSTIRAVVCSTPDGNQLVSDIVCGVGHADMTLHCTNTFPLSLESFLIQWGLQDGAKIKKIKSVVKEKAETILERWMRYENNMNKEERGALSASKSVLGVNFILTQKEDGSYDAVAISINNSRKAIANTQIYESQNPVKLGSSLRPLVATMVNRSQRFLLRGKKILLIGAAENFVWEAGEEYDIKIVLIDPNPNHSAAKRVHKFIQCDIGDHTHDDDNTEKIVQIVRAHNLAIDGCMTVVEDYVPLASLVCKALRMIGSSPEVARISKKKSLTQRALEEESSRNKIPFLPNPSLFAIKTLEINQPGDVTGSSNLIQYPALLKPEYGCCSFGIALVKDEKDCMKRFISTQNILRMSEEICFGMNHGNEMHLAEYAQGIKHGVEVVVFRGKLIAAFISDCGPSRLPLFFETTACMPSCLPLDKQQQLVTATSQCLTAIGVTDGVFSVEFKTTPTGPKLIEINGRVSSVFYRNWIRIIYEVDILFQNFLIACGIQPCVQPLEPSCQLMGVTCFQTAHAKVLTRPGVATPDILVEAHERGEIIFFDISPPVEDERVHEKELCQIAVKGESVSDAKRKLLAICKKYGVDNPEYQVEHMLSTFVEFPKL
ncbi:carnosine synthase 1 [Lingula anatina]|uniref:Carnosine synthase 1 n=1 Tax=Lingula anatina TaxID=7574 RepID=A0A1S3HDF5_LINAN|nr:carnosine synthase 1 [Lingula anatina]|eukprot:XP_013384068.1 carnosine synthase 1 [Lingula anatina]